MNDLKNPCPEPQQLKKFVLGELSIAEIEDYQQHLSHCDPCVETIASLKVDDTFSGIARQAFQEDDLITSAGDQSVVDNMIRQASQWSRDQANLELPRSSVNELDRSVEVQRLLREPIGPEDIGAIAHYRVQQLLGTGSTGVVYLALDTKLDRQVVLKILRPSLGDAARQRFVAEGRATAKLDHQNIVTIYEVGSDGPLSYLAMQWLPGQTLDQKLQNEESFSVADAKELARQIASGLAAAHAQDLIHRDIKPANIWIPDGDVPAKILDFGLVRIADEDPQLTCTGMIAGTPCFMSPEQSRGDVIDARSDLFSLGCVIYQCLTGRLPFRSDNALATLRSIQQDQPTHPQERDPNIDHATSDLVMCLLEKSPSRRPKNAAAVVSALNSEPQDWSFQYEPPTQAKPKKAPGGFWKSMAALIIGIGLGAFALAYGQQIIRIVTDRGLIEIESMVNDVKIEIVDGGEVVKVVDLATEQSIEIKSGQYEIRPLSEDNSIEVENGNLILSRGETEIVRVARSNSVDSRASAGSKKMRQFPINAETRRKTIEKVKNWLDGNVKQRYSFTTDQRMLGVSTTAENAEQVFSAVKRIIRENEGPYRLQPGDVLGVFIDGLIGRFDADPPVHYPADGRPPVIGFPIPIDHDGTISIPILGDVKVATMTVQEARQKLIVACTKEDRDGKGPLLRSQSRIMLNLIRRADESALASIGSTSIGNKISSSDAFNPSTARKTGTLSQLPLTTQTQVIGQPEIQNELPSNKQNPDFESPTDSFELPPLTSSKNEEWKYDPNEPLELPSIVRMARNEKQHEQALRQAKEKIKKLEKLSGNSPDHNIQLITLNAKIELQRVKADGIVGTYVFDPEPLRAILRLRQDQLKLIDNRLFDGPEEFPEKDLVAVRKKIRYELGVARKELFDFESSNQIRPFTQPVYEDQIYEDWYRIAQNERKLETLNLAIQSMANLAGPNEKLELLETVVNIETRGIGVSDPEHAKAISQTVEQIYELTELETFVELLTRILRSGDPALAKKMLRSNFRYNLIQKVERGDGSDLAESSAKNLVDALGRFADSRGIATTSLALVKELVGAQNRWDLASHPVTKQLGQQYFDAELKAMSFKDYFAYESLSVATYRPIDLYQFLAKHVPEVEGLRDRISRDVETARQMSQRHGAKMAKQSRGGKQPDANSRASNDVQDRIASILTIANQQPKTEKLQQQLIDWVNEEVANLASSQTSTPLPVETLYRMFVAVGMEGDDLMQQILQAKRHKLFLKLKETGNGLELVTQE